jgi:hypothetical protein
LADGALVVSCVRGGDGVPTSAGVGRTADGTAG